MDHVKIRHPVRVSIIYIVEMCFYDTLISIQTLRGRKAPYTSTPAIAQLVERLTVEVYTRNQLVAGSIPAAGTCIFFCEGGVHAPTFALRPKRGPTSLLVLEVESATLGATWSSVRKQGLPWALATRFRSGRVA